MRMQHYAIFLRAFTYTIRFKKSEANANADCLSRLPIQGSEKGIDVIDVHFINLVSTIPVTFDEIEKKIDAHKDADLCQVIKFLKEGKEINTKKVWNCDPKEFHYRAKCC